MDVTYAIVKVYVTERNDVIKRHSYVITICWTPAIEVTALLKNLRPEMKGAQEKESIMGMSGRQKNPSLKPDSDPRDGFFYLPLTPMIDRYSLSLGAIWWLWSVTVVLSQHLITKKTPIQIYWKSHHQKTESFQIKVLIFFIFLLKT